MPAFSWTTDPELALVEQGNLHELVVLNSGAAKGAGFSKGLAIGTSYEENTKRAIAIGVPFGPDGYYSVRTPHLVADLEVDFPYVPGLLAYRVGPAICSLLDEVRSEYDFLLIDGQGIAHPRGIGLASQIGVLYNLMSLGVTRNNLFGRCGQPPPGRFNHSPILHARRTDILGYAVSLGEKCPPCYISPGHRLSPDEAVDLFRRIAGTNTCFPRPLKRAHALANTGARAIWNRRKNDLIGEEKQ